MKFLVLSFSILFLTACTSDKCGPFNTTCYKEEVLTITQIDSQAKTIRVVDEWGSGVGTYRVNNPNFWNCTQGCYSIGDSATFTVKYRFWYSSSNVAEGIKYKSR